MAGTLKKRLEAWQRHLSERFGTDISTPAARRAARKHYQWVDHGFLRILWRNFHQIAPGVYRSNQPSDGQLRAIHDKVGLHSVLNLRGESRQSFYLFEAEVCEKLGLELVSLPLSARQAPSVANLELLISHMQTMPKPVLIHCKSGADRTGLAAALYLLIFEGQPIEVAMRQLSFRYIHVSYTATGILDHFLRVYEDAFRDSGIGFLEWMRTAYDPAELTASFARWQAGDRSLR